MIPLIRGGGRLPLMALASGLGVWVCSASSGMADGGGSAGAELCPTCQKPCADHHRHDGSGFGTLGYGKPGLYPGFQGFGLGYHPGYGYGGDALGVGADGGYPLYGGPGYPHPWPCLRRVGGITPFHYFGGPGYPSPEHPNYFGGSGPLAPDQPVITFASDPRDPGNAGGYGPFSGSIPYPETTFAPSVTIVAADGSTSAMSSAPLSTTPPNIAPATGNVPDGAAAGRSLGIDAEPVVDAGRARGLKVTGVHPRSVAEQAGLHAGDVIRSINGYVTEEPSNLAWIIANAAPDHVLMMNVRTASESKEHTIRAQLP